MNSIIWKGVPSTTIKGLLISQLPPISKPPMRVSETMVDGRDGSIIEDLGYSPYDKSLVIGLLGDFDINKVIKYFTGEGEIVFSNEPDKVYNAKIVGQIDYTRLLRYRQATIPFRVQPFKHKLLEAYKPAPTEAVSGTSFVVPDIADAKLKTFSIYGKTTQNGTPTPETPVELVSVGDSGSITVNATRGNESQSTAIATQNGLRGIPVPSGGNYTDANGQQWVCDEIDVVRGILVTRVALETISQKPVFKVIDGRDGRFFCEGFLGGTYKNGGEKALSNFAKWESWGNGKQGDACFAVSNRNLYYYSSTALTTDDVNALFAEMIASETPPVILAQLATPIETPLPTEELSAYDNLHINEPNTTVLNDANAHMKLEYFKPFEVFNEGMETSKPIMVLKGEGTVVISVNGYEIFQYTFPDGENEVVIDSEKEDAYLGDVLKNRNMNGEFPVLLPGTNIIEWSGYVSSIEILPRSRWL